MWRADAEEVASPGKQWPGDMGWSERLRHTLHLWPYMVPLISVYFAEYAMQTGTWTAIGWSPARASPLPLLD